MRLLEYIGTMDESIRAFVYSTAYTAVEDFLLSDAYQTARDISEDYAHRSMLRRARVAAMAAEDYATANPDKIVFDNKKHQLYKKALKAGDKKA